MRIIVCLKEVLDPDAVNAYAVGGRLTISDDGRSIATTAIPHLINAYDEQAIEAALQVKEAGTDAEIVAVSIGGSGDHLKRAAALGITDITHIQFDGTLDTGAAATILAAFVRSRGGADLVLCGRQASDDDQGVVPAMLAEMLDVPVVAMTRELRVEGSSATIRRVTPNGDEVVKVSLPAVATITSEFGTPRYPTAAGMMAARRVKPTVTTIDALGVDANAVAPRVTLSKMFVPEVQGNCEFLQGTPAEVARELIRRLRAEGVIA